MIGNDLLGLIGQFLQGQPVTNEIELVLFGLSNTQMCKLRDLADLRRAQTYRLAEGNKNLVLVDIHLITVEIGKERRNEKGVTITDVDVKITTTYFNLKKLEDAPEGEVHYEQTAHFIGMTKLISLIEEIWELAGLRPIAPMNLASRVLTLKRHPTEQQAMQITDSSDWVANKQ